MATTALILATEALQLLGVVDPNEAITSADGQKALGVLNRFVDTLGALPLAQAFVVREVFPLTANKGSEANPYLIGPGGDFNTTRPIRLEGAGLVMNPGTATEVEIPRGLYTDDAWALNQVKQLTALLFTNVYYRATYAASTVGCGTIVLWPIPTTAANSIALYHLSPIAQFATLNTSYTFPPGYQEMFVSNLAIRLAPSYLRPLDPVIAQLATETLAAVKRANTKMADLDMDLALVNDRRSGYNILSGSGD